MLDKQLYAVKLRVGETDDPTAPIISLPKPSDTFQLFAFLTSAEANGYGDLNNSCDVFFDYQGKMTVKTFQLWDIDPLHLA